MKINWTNIYADKMVYFLKHDIKKELANVYYKINYFMEMFVNACNISVHTKIKMKLTYEIYFVNEIKETIKDEISKR